MSRQRYEIHRLLNYKTASLKERNRSVAHGKTNRDVERRAGREGRYIADSDLPARLNLVHYPTEMRCARESKERVNLLSSTNPFMPRHLSESANHLQKKLFLLALSVRGSFSFVRKSNKLNVNEWANPYYSPPGFWGGGAAHIG